MADVIQGLSIGLGLDSSGLDQGLKSLKGKLKLVNSEMAANMSAFDRGERSVNKYETQIGGLTRKLDVQKAAVNAARTEYERMVAQHGEGSVQAERAATAYNTEVAAVNNLQRHVEGLTDELRQFQAEQDAANSGMGRLGASLDSVGGKVSAIGGKVTSAGKGLSLGLTAPILAFGAAGVAAFNEVDEAVDTIITKTGATGEAAEALTDNFKTVAKRVPQDLQSVGEAIGEVNTQFGFMGKELEDASQLMLEFADINGTDVTTASIASKQAIEAYGLANSDLNGVLDAVTKTAQDTGQSVDDLFDKATKGAPQIKALGLNFAEGTALIGGFEKAGVDSGAALSSLSKAQVIFAKDGKTLEEGLNGTVDAILNAKTETEALTIASEVFGTKGGPRMVDAIQRGTFNLEDFAGAGEKAAGAVKNTFNETVDPIDQAAIAMNNAKLAMGEVGDQIQVALLPFMEKATEVLGNVADKFGAMSPEAKKSALMIGGIAAAAGPVLVVLGSLMSGLGAVITFVGSAATAVSIMGTGVAATTPLIGGLASAFTIMTGPIGLAVAAIAGIGIATGLLVKHFSEDAIPEIDRFGEGVSASTQKALGSFFELSDGVGQSMAELTITTSEVTTEIATDMTGKFAEMNAQILEGMNTRHAAQIESMTTFFANSSVLTDEQEASIIQKQQWSNETQIATQEQREARVKEILDAASKEKRALTENEEIEINAIRTSMNNTAVEALSANEVEQKIIMERMKATAGDLSARQAAEVVKKSAEQRDGAVKAAEEQYDGTVAEIIRMRDETGSISSEQATKLIAEATKTKDTNIASAKTMHKDVVSEAKLQAEEHVDKVDWQTGEILSKWDIYKNGVLERFKSTNKESLEDFKRWGTNFDEGWTTFNTKAKVKVDAWKANVKQRMSESFSDTKRDFSKWGTDFDTGWTNFNTKAKAKVDEYKAGVVSRFKTTNSESLADFKRWGGNLKEWATDAKNKVLETFTNMVTGAKNLPGRIGEGIKSMAYKVADGVKSVSNRLASTLGTGVNGVIGGVNWVLGKIGVNSKNHVPLWPVPKYAHGTDGHKGGLAILGDGRGSNAGRELIQTPSGELSLSPAKDTLMNLPKGAQVLSAKKTKELLGNVPKYANGIGDFFGDIWDYAKNPSKLLNVALGALGISAPKGGSFVGDMAKGGYNKVKDGALDYIKGKLKLFEETAGSGGKGFGPPFRLTSRRGMRVNPVTKKWAMHEGDDWGAPYGTPIPAQSAGVVTQSGFHGIRGNYVRVKGGAYEHLYQHNARNSVKVGQLVRPGQTVGTVGSTGRSTGPHLHHELKKNGVNINPQGMETGGLIKSEQLIRAGEKNREEIMIPLHPSRRTDAMKLLALAGKRLMGSDKGVVRPDQLPNVQGNSGSGNVLQKLLAATLEQNQLLLQLLQKDNNLYLDGDILTDAITPGVSRNMGGRTSLEMAMKGM